MTHAHQETVEATVTAELPQRLFRLETADGASIVAGPSEEASRLGVQPRTGQRVLVLRASLDPGRGVIVGLADNRSGTTQGSNEGKS